MALNVSLVATNTAPTGAENTGVTRPIFRKNTVVETTTPLPVSGVFTGQWHDTQAEGTAQVCLTSLSNQASTASGFIIQEADDIGNPGFTRTVQSGTASANTLARVFATIRARYWRVKYTNGATLQGSFEITSCSTNTPVFANATDFGLASNIANPLVAVAIPGSYGSLADNSTSSTVATLLNTVGAGAPLEVFSPIYGGSFSGTASVGLQGWSRPRTPTIFKQASTRATGNTALWTPATNNKFRLLKFKVQVTGDSNTLAASQLTVGLQDATTDLGLSHIISLPATATLISTSVNDGYDSGWIDLGQFGLLSATAGNVLNINLSEAVLTGLVNVVACGTEE